MRAMTLPSRDESRDTGMAMVLLALLVHLAWRSDWLVPAALVLLVLTMTAPRVFAPVAVVWLGLSRIIGTVTSTVLLTIVFALVVTPIGWIRRLMGADPLVLRRFKSSDDSVLVRRNHTFSPADLERPY